MASEMPDPETRKAVRNDSGSRPLRLLVIEDNPGDARLIRELLSETPDLVSSLEHCSRLAEAADCWPTPPSMPFFWTWDSRMRRA